MRPNLAILPQASVKIRGGVGEIFGSINEVLNTIEPPEYI